MNDTIYALSSGPLPAGIAVVRISGTRAAEILKALAGALPAPRFARTCKLKAVDGSHLDHALVLYFERNASFTGEDVVELHLHGGRAVLKSVLDELSRFADTRPAEPGEFTRRAFINGRMDLTSAEGVADLIEAETEAQKRFALANASGKQANLYSKWRRQLIEGRALIEADLDFSDEADVPGSVADAVVAEIKALRLDIEKHVADARRGEIIRNGFRVVIIGKPNVGKSSLINALARRDVAIVSDEAGTTRDLIEVSLDLDGFKVILTDTAGIRETSSKIEQIGIERAQKAAQSADLVLSLYSADDQAAPTADAGPNLRVVTKSDLFEKKPVKADHCISTLTGEGMDALLADIAQRARSAAGTGSDVLPSRERQVHYLQRCVVALSKAEEVSLPLELQAEELRIAADHLGRITGVIDVEDLLDVVFSRFCIGK